MQAAVPPKAQKIPAHKISTIKNMLSIGIFLAVVCYSAIYADNTFPISEGWNVNYVELISGFLLLFAPAEPTGRCCFLETLFWKPFSISILVGVATRSYFYIAVPPDFALHQHDQRVCGMPVFDHALCGICL